MLIFLVVLYKQSLKDSSTLQSLSKCFGLINDSIIVLWDNSPERLPDEEIDEIKKDIPNVIYKHTPQNYALSVIYNKVIAEYITPDKYLVLLDQDSNFTTQFVSEIQKGISDNPQINLFVPVVKVNNKIHSPAKYFFVKAFFYKSLEPGLISSDHKTAINSGMVISGRYLNAGFKYDERLKFYGTDNYFMYNFIKYNKEFFVLNYTLMHDLSFISNVNTERKLQIFREIKTANLIVYQDQYFYLFLAYIYNLLVSIKYAITFKNLNYLR